MAGTSEARNAAPSLRPMMSATPPGGHDDLGVVGVHHGEAKAPGPRGPPHGAGEALAGAAASRDSIRWARTSVSVRTRGGGRRR